MTRHSSTLAMPRGRPKPIRTAITRSGSMMSETRTDHYGYNDRSELVSGTKDTAATNLTEYAYQYDDIGNRLSSLDLGTNRTYTANSLNQYTNIVEGADGFLPQFDDDGNQTLIKTATGIWQVTYNGENRPVLWECGSTNITMKFDRMGRRVEYVEMVSGVTNTHHRFVYDGYVCIQRLNAASNNAIDLVFGWDPSEPVATRPLVLQKYGQYNLFYTHDGNKNVSELVFFQQANGIAAHYEYAPFGAVTAATRNTPVTAYDFREYNPFRFSSECADDALGLVYYNYRHYYPEEGKWCERDPLSEEGGINLYSFLQNEPSVLFDRLGRKCTVYVFIGHYPGIGSEYEYDQGSILATATNTINDCNTSCDGILSLSCHMKTFLDAATNAFPRIKTPDNWPPEPYTDDRNTNISDFDVLVSSGKFDNAIANVSASISSDCCCESITVKIKCDQQATKGFALLSRPGVGSLRQEQNPCVNGGKEYVLPNKNR